MKCAVTGCDRRAFTHGSVYDEGTVCSKHFHLFTSDEFVIQDDETALSALYRIGREKREAFLANMQTHLERLGYTPDVARRAVLGFSGYDRVQGDNSDRIIQSLRTVIESPRKWGRGVWMYGLEGRGKTYLSAVIIRELLYKHEDLPLNEIKYIVHRQYMDELLDQSTSRQRQRYLREVYEHNAVIVFDELLQKPTQYSIEHFRGVIEGALRKRCFVIVCSNHSDVTLAEVERTLVAGGAAPVTSRMIGNYMRLPIVGPDRRVPRR